MTGELCIANNKFHTLTLQGSLNTPTLNATNRDWEGIVGNCALEECVQDQQIEAVAGRFLCTGLIRAFEIAISGEQTPAFEWGLAPFVIDPSPNYVDQNPTLLGHTYPPKELLVSACFTGCGPATYNKNFTLYNETSTGITKFSVSSSPRVYDNGCNSAGDDLACGTGDLFYTFQSGTCGASPVDMYDCNSIPRTFNPCAIEYSFDPDSGSSDSFGCVITQSQPENILCYEQPYGYGLCSSGGSAACLFSPDVSNCTDLFGFNGLQDNARPGTCISTCSESGSIGHQCVYRMEVGQAYPPNENLDDSTEYGICTDIGVCSPTASVCNADSAVGNFCFNFEGEPYYCLNLFNTQDPKAMVCVKTCAANHNCRIPYCADNAECTLNTPIQYPTGVVTIITSCNPGVPSNAVCGAYDCGSWTCDLSADPSDMDGNGCSLDASPPPDDRGTSCTLQGGDTGQCDGFGMCQENLSDCVNGECDDGYSCTLDECVGSVCKHTVANPDPCALLPAGDCGRYVCNVTSPHTRADGSGCALVALAPEGQKCNLHPELARFSSDGTGFCTSIGVCIPRQVGPPGPAHTPLPTHGPVPVAPSGLGPAPDPVPAVPRPTPLPRVPLHGFTSSTAPGASTSDSHELQTIPVSSLHLDLRHRWNFVNANNNQRLIEAPESSIHHSHHHHGSSSSSSSSSVSEDLPFGFELHTADSRVVTEPWELASKQNYPKENLDQMFIVKNQLEDDDFGDPEDNILYNQLRERPDSFNCDIFTRRDSHHNAYPGCGGAPDAVGPLLTGVYDGECTPVCWCMQITFMDTTWSHPYICTRNFFPGAGTIEPTVGYYVNVALLGAAFGMTMCAIAAMYTEAVVIALYQWGWFRWSLSHVKVTVNRGKRVTEEDAVYKKYDDYQDVDTGEFEEPASEGDENPFIVDDRVRDRFPTGDRHIKVFV